MAKPKVDKWELVNVWSKTAQRLRIISKLTGQSLISVIDLASLEAAKKIEKEIAVFEQISKEAKSNGQEN